MLDRLNEKRADLMKQVNAIDYVLSIMTDEIKERGEGKNTIKAKIVNRLEHGTSTIKDLSKGLNRNTVRNALWTLRNEGIVTKEGNGYQLARSSSVMH